MDMPLIAVVDDDASYRELMTDVFGGEGYRVAGCATTEEALALVARTRPDAVILDLWLGSRDAGWCLLERLRRDPRLDRVPILICTGDLPRLMAHSDQLRRWGCASLAKPFDLADLLDGVAAMTTPRTALPYRLARGAPSCGR
jgi:CheY-like chemotaxis protein